MGIDVYLSWAGQTPEEQAAQDEAHLALDEGSVGYLRESYSGGPYVTKILPGMLLSRPRVRPRFQRAYSESGSPASRSLPTDLTPAMLLFGRSRGTLRTQGPAFRTRGRPTRRQ